jgi:group II intron reverse transcriptase/maturase
MIIKSGINDIFKTNNVRNAIAELQTKKNACGDDGVWLYDLEKFWNVNGQKIVNQIHDKKYIPQIVHEKIIVSANGKRRKIALMSSVDRMIQRAVLQIIKEEVEKLFSKYSFAYRDEKGTDTAIKCAAEYIESGKEYVVELDVKDFFDEISHKILLETLKDAIEDESLYFLLEQYIVCRVESDYKLEQKHKGIVQGAPISPMLSNIYLTEFDYWMENQAYAFVRFADNINVYVNSIEEGTKVMNAIETKLFEYKLCLNESKRGVFNAFSRKYLGFQFEKVGTSILVKRITHGKKNVFGNWHKNSLQKIDHNFYIVNDGVLTKKDFTILFDNEEKKTHIPVETTDAINIYSNVIFSSNFIETLNKYSLNLNVYDKYGVFVGGFLAANQRNRMKSLIQQVKIYSDNEQRLKYARAIDIASIHNLRCNLKYYLKHNTSVLLSETIEYLTEGIRELNESKDINQILMIEARCRQKYYHCFNEMFSGDSFHFTVRTKRPPKDEVNAMISFGNVYLYQKIAQMIYRTSLDIRISFVHSAMRRNENLNLDLADIFKPIIVDRVICTLINKKMISKEKHFEKAENNGIYMNKEGKIILLQELDRKLRQIITVGKIEYTYERLMYQEVRKLESCLLNGMQYKPFKYQL